VTTQSVLQKADALLLVHVQRDFCPGGALPVPEGDRVVPVLNHWIDLAAAAGVPVYAARDWHPRGHPSFREEGGEWPPHCLQDSSGASFHQDLRIPADAVLVTSGVRFDQDQYSAFNQTGFAEKLRRDGVTRLWVGGLALDVCVQATVLDALTAGFEVTVIVAGTRALGAEGGAAALARMAKAGAVILQQ